jgi:hypothetical protein
VFLLCQGTQSRGIIANGTILTDISSGTHWDGSARPANFVDVVFECVVPVDDRLPTEVLEHQLPEQHWQPAASGNLVKAALVGPLEELWSSHLALLGLHGTKGQQQSRLMDAVRRKKIEEAAQDRLMEH